MLSRHSNSSIQKKVKLLWHLVEGMDACYRSDLQSWPEKIQYDLALDIYRDRCSAESKRLSSGSRRPSRPHTEQPSSPAGYDDEDGEDELPEDELAEDELAEDSDDEPPLKKVVRLKLVRCMLPIVYFFAENYLPKV